MSRMWDSTLATCFGSHRSQCDDAPPSRDDDNISNPRIRWRYWKKGDMGGGVGHLGGVEGVCRTERLLSLLIRPNRGGTSSSGLLKLSSSHCWPAGARERVFAAAPAQEHCSQHKETFSTAQLDSKLASRGVASVTPTFTQSLD